MSEITPLEAQFLAFREEYPNVILMMEVGYKYRFFEDDALVGFSFGRDID